MRPHRSNLIIIIIVKVGLHYSIRKKLKQCCSVPGRIWEFYLSIFNIEFDI